MYKFVMKKVFVLVLALIFLIGCSSIEESEEQIASMPVSKENDSNIASGEYDEQENNMEDSFSEHTDAVETDNVTKVQVRSGSTGEEIIIEDVDLINNIVNSLKAFDVEKYENGNLQGYSYSISLYNNDILLQNMLIRGDSIEIDGVIYYVGSTQDIIEYIQ